MLGFSLFGQSLNKSLIESTILINVDSLRKESNQILLGRRVLDDQQELTLEGKLAPLESMIIPVDDLIADMEDALKPFKAGDEQAEEAFFTQLNIWQKTKFVLHSQIIKWFQR